ncbi:MAG: hypothetical protein ACJA2X_002435 [Halocynthiibacter sp.]|jgi:hypothetical protein
MKAAISKGAANGSFVRTADLRPTSLTDQPNEKRQMTGLSPELSFMVFTAKFLFEPRVSHAATRTNDWFKL